MAGIYGDATQYLSLWNVAPASEMVLRFTPVRLFWLHLHALFLSRTTSAPVSLSREAGNHLVKSLLMRLGMWGTPAVSWPWEPWRSAACWASSGFNLSFLNSSCSCWHLIGVGCCICSPIKRARVAPRGGPVGREVWEHFSISVSNWKLKESLLTGIINN